MRKITPILLSLLISLSAPSLAQDMGGMDGGMGGMGGGGMGGGGGPPDDGGGEQRARAPQGPKPIKRARFDKVVTDMFREADTNHDGTVTLAELHTLVEARRLAIIQARFAKVDTDRNGSISVAEFQAWQLQLGAAAAQDSAASSERDGPIPEAVMPDAGKEPEDRMLTALIEPLSGTVIARANTNYDGGLSLDELLAYEGKIFDAADTDHDGYLSMPELRPKGRGGMRGPGGPGGPGGPPPPGNRPS